MFYYEISAKDTDYCPDQFLSLEFSEMNTESYKENFFVEDQQNSFNDKYDHSEYIINEEITSEKLNQNYYNKSPKKSKLLIEEDEELLLKTENLQTSLNTKKKFESSDINKNSKEEKLKKGNKHNLIRKSKKIIIDTALIFINNIIFIVYEGNIGKGIFKKELKKIEPNESHNTKVNDNLNLLNKTLKDIFSAKINGKYTGFDVDINKSIIEELLNEKEENKKKIFTDLFNKTFLDFILMLKEPKGELKEIYENNLLKSSKKDFESLEEITKIINNYEKEFQEMKPKRKNNNKVKFNIKNK